MQSAQESLAELRAAIRYCENAISAAESTIESMDFRQQIARQESTGREVALTEMVKKLEEANDAIVIENDNLYRENAKLRKDKERLTALEVQLRDKIRELKENKTNVADSNI
jgi:predicted  nucleic acid-binding Zn-ribbon protein